MLVGELMVLGKCSCAIQQIKPHSNRHWGCCSGRTGRRAYEWREEVYCTYDQDVVVQFRGSNFTA